MLRTRNLHKINVLRDIGIGLVAIAAMLLAPVLTPQASASSSDCYSNSICFWEHARSEGAFISWQGPARYHCITMPSYWWDRASSVWNRLPYRVTAYTQQNCGGWGMDFYSGEYVGSVSGGYNDEFRSFWVN